MENTYFSWLPNEIILQILKKLKHFDILQFLEAFPNFSYEFRNLNLSMVDHRITNLTSQIALKQLIALEHITSLNINHLYWISAVDLRRFINKLINLKSLYAIYTKLDLTQNDIKTYNHTKIEKLAISSSHFVQADRDPVLGVKVLYIRLTAESDSEPYWITDEHKIITRLVSLFPNVTKIWVEDRLFGPSVNLLDYFNNYEKIFMKCVNFVVRDNIRSGKYFDTLRDLVHIICIDKLEGKEIFCDQSLLQYLIENHATHGLWNRVLKTLRTIPFSPNDTRDLILNKINLQSICLEDLNFFNNCPIEDKDGSHLKISQMQRDILSSKNARTLRSVCFMSCVLMIVDGKSEQKTEDNGIPLKKPRIADNSQTLPQETQPVKKLFENLTSLEELVLCSCSCVSSSVKITGYNFISNCTKLKSLSIEIPRDCDGELFLSIFKDCPFLETVKVESPFTQSDQFNTNFLKALPMANNLKDLFFENGCVPIEKFVTTCTSMQSRKLQRLALVCTERSRPISFSSLKAFITSFPDLTFLLICNQNMSKASIKTFTRFLKGLTTHPTQTFVIRQDYPAFELADGIPDVHFDLLGKRHCFVASIDPFKDFAHF